MLPLFLIVLVDLIGFGLVIPLLPFYAERFDAQPLTVALLMAVFSFAQLLAAPFLGRLSDRIGRKPVLVVSTAGAAAAYLWLAYADALWTLFLARAFAGALAGNISAAFAYVADVTRPEDRAKGMGTVGAAIGLGFIFGPAIGGILAGADAATADYATPCLVAAGLSATAFVLAMIMLRESRPAHAGTAPHRNAISQFAMALGRPQIAVPVVLAFLATFVFAGMEATFAMWSERRFGWGPLQNGYLFAVLGVLSVAVQGGAVGALARRFGEKTLLVGGAVLFAIGLLLTALADGVPAVAAAMSLLAVGFGVFNPTLNALMSLRIESHEQGALLGIGRSAAILGRVLGPAWAGILFTHVGIDWPFLGGAVVMALVIVVAVQALPGTDKR